MDQSYVNKRKNECLTHLGHRGLSHGRVDEGSSGALFSVRLEGKLSIFDIALLPNGMTALREVDDFDESRRVLTEQACPEFIINLAKDLELGHSCSHLQIRR